MDKSAPARSSTASSDPAILFAGVNIALHKAYYGERTGSLVKIVRGVYVRKDITPVERKAALLEHATRIAAYIFPKAILSGPSAFRSGPVNGVLHIAQSNKLAPLDVDKLFKIAPHVNADTDGGRGEIENVVVEDSLGPLRLRRFTPEYLLLAAFKPPTAKPRDMAALSPADLVEMVNGMLKATGASDLSVACAHVLNRLQTLAGIVEIKVPLDQVKEYLLSFGVKAAERRMHQALNVYWHDRAVGTLRNDGRLWEFEYAPSIGLKLSLSEPPGVKTLEVPNFMGSILPENSNTDSGSMEDRLELFAGGTRFISNISVHAAEDAAKIKYVPDVLSAKISNFSTEHLEFKGHVTTQMRDILHDPHLLNEARMSPGMPRISGMQVKIPSNLDKAGNLNMAIDRSFSHIVKIVGGGTEYSSMCSMEWFSLTVAKQIGLSVEDFAIADIGISSPALIVERFDIRKDFNDKRHILAEDFWSILGLRKNDLKYHGDLIDVAEVIMKQSTNREADGIQLLAQSMMSWVMFNGDMHLKNLLMIKESSDLRTGFDNIRLSPAYDMMCTQVFPNDPKSSAIAIAGNRHHTLHGFIQLGRALGIGPDHVVSMAKFVSANVAKTGHLVSQQLPRVIAQHAKSVSDIKLATRLFDVRCMDLINEVEIFSNGNRKSRAEIAPRIPDDQVDAEEHREAEVRRSERSMGIEGEFANETFDGSGVDTAAISKKRPHP